MQFYFAPLNDRKQRPMAMNVCMHTKVYLLIHSNTAKVELNNGNCIDVTYDVVRCTSPRLETNQQVSYCTFKLV